MPVVRTATRIDYDRHVREWTARRVKAAAAEGRAVASELRDLREEVKGEPREADEHETGLAPRDYTRAFRAFNRLRIALSRATRQAPPTCAGCGRRIDRRNKFICLACGRSLTEEAR